MKYGDIITVKTTAGVVTRRVLEAHKTYVLACRESVFQEGWDGSMDNVMGWPWIDVTGGTP